MGLIENVELELKRCSDERILLLREKVNAEYNRRFEKERINKLLLGG